MPLPPDDDTPTTRPTPHPIPEPTAAVPVPGAGADAGPGWRIGGRYRVTGRLGSGGMADVFRAHDELLQRDVAVKVFRTAVSAPDTAAGVERQRAELHALARLNHPHLITLYDGSIGDTDTPGVTAYLVMELIDGPTLADRIAQGPLPETEIRVVGRQVADALAYVHENGMVHRDVKPANILLGAGGLADLAPIRARLSDFGIVRLLGADRLTNVDSTLGTASYLAPEQARGSGVGPPADVYALGLTLIEAFTGVRSFEGDTPLEAVIARLDRDPVVPQHLPAPWPALLAAMTRRDPAARPNAGQVAQALRTPSDSTTQLLTPRAAVADGTAVLAAVPAAAAAYPAAVVSAPPRLPAAGPERRSRTGLWIGLALAAIVLALGIAILLATTGGSGSPSTGTTPPSRTPSRTGTASKTTSGTSRAPSSSSSQPSRPDSQPARSTSGSRSSTRSSRPPSSASSTPRTSSRPASSSASTPAPSVSVPSLPGASTGP